MLNKKANLRGFAFLFNQSVEGLNYDNLIILIIGKHT